MNIKNFKVREKSNLIDSFILIACFLATAPIAAFAVSTDTTQQTAERPPIEVIFAKKQFFHPRGEKQISGVVFRSSKGNELKRLSFGPGEFIEEEHRVHKLVHALVSKDQSHVVIYEWLRDQDERNPYKIRFSSAVHLSWYRADGTLSCELQTRVVPIRLSANGKALVAQDGGFDPVSFEVYHDVPKLKSLDQLENDHSLTDSYLYVLNDRCEIMFSTTSSKGSWGGTLLISPTGKWLVFQQPGPPIIEKDVWKDWLKAIHLIRGEVYGIDWGEKTASLREIDDDGVIVGWKLMGQGKTKHRVRFFKGEEREVHRDRFRKYIWRPGQHVLKETNEEKEE
ncbi:MAG: hypothetical protein HYT79_08305 [Elusimicrobia bacterium]|nr:hypothetical protein [Elusimicrobiota bacterium]